MDIIERVAISIARAEGKTAPIDTIREENFNWYKRNAQAAIKETLDCLIKEAVTEGTLWANKTILSEHAVKTISNIFFEHAIWLKQKRDEL